MIHGDRLNFSLTPEQRLTLRCVAPAPEEDGSIIVLSHVAFLHPRSAAGPLWWWGGGGGGGGGGGEGLCACVTGVSWARTCACQVLSLCAYCTVTYVRGFRLPFLSSFRVVLCADVGGTGPAAFQFTSVCVCACVGVCIACV